VKKLIYPLIACSALAATAALAGGPDLVAPPQPCTACVIPFLDGELGAAWRNISDVSLPGHVVVPAALGNFAFPFNILGAFGPATVVLPGFNHSEKHFAARVAAGLKFPITPMFRVVTELGWGWYGKDELNHAFTFTQPGLFFPTFFNRTITSNTNFETKVWGFDAMIGGEYTIFNNVNLFAKVGGMMENWRPELHNTIVVTHNFTGVPGTFAPFTSTRTFNTNFKHTESEAVPAVIIGAQYEVTQWLGIHVKYLHTFGGKTRLFDNNFGSGTTVNGTTTFFNTNVNWSAPTINAVFGGLEVRLPT